MDDFNKKDSRSEMIDRISKEDWDEAMKCFSVTCLAFPPIYSKIWFYKIVNSKVTTECQTVDGPSMEGLKIVLIKIMMDPDFIGFKNKVLWPLNQDRSVEIGGHLNFTSITLKIDLDPHDMKISAYRSIGTNERDKYQTTYNLRQYEVDRDRNDYFMRAILQKFDNLHNVIPFLIG